MKRAFRLMPAFIFLAVSFAAFCQKNPLDSIHSSKPLAVLNCGVPLVTNACNQVFNNNLTPVYAACVANNFQDPFVWCYAEWGRSHGSPQVNLRLPLIGAGINHASMWALYVTSNPPQELGEGIATRVPNLIPGHKYAMSFYRRTWLNIPAPSPYLDQVNILMMKCNDFIPTNWDTVPNPPVNSQAVYCETNVNKPNWERIAQTFTANDNYDMIRIYPKQTSLPVNSQFPQWWLDFGKLELVDVTNFSAGPPPIPVYPNNCTVTIGPAMPNTCALTGAVYTWHGPSGQVIAAPANQQISVDASNPANAGQWTLKMTIPGIITTNNTCSNALDVQASVVVPYCTNCPNPPQILTTSYFDKGCNIPYNPIIPYQLNTYCYPWECGGATHLYSNFSSNNQWYVNGTLITGNGGDYPDIGQISITNNTQQFRHVLFSSSVTNQGLPFKYQLKNTSGGCNDLTTPTYVFFGSNLFSNEEMGPYKPNYTRMISTPWNFSYGPGAIYNWSVPGAIVTDIDPTTPEASVYFPANIPIPDVMGTLTVTNSIYCNGSYNLHFFYNPNLRTNLAATELNANVKEDNINSKIFPNPATNQITIQSESLIKSVSIIGELRPQPKIVQVNSQKSITINLANLQPGIYNCQITTQKGIENQKLVIKQ
jgi:Secretion system C-terminal sorting domain